MQMDDSANLDGSYRIEVSGWSFDKDFFVEQTDLFWDRSGEKKVLLHHAPAEGGMLFVRLLWPSPAGNTVPVAYQAAAVFPTDRNGRSEIRLKRLHPRTKVSQRGEFASYVTEDVERTYDPNERPAQLEHEEILR